MKSRIWVSLLLLGASLLVPCEVSAQVVISQIYGGGGNSGATLRNDFVELLNTGNSPVSVSGWCVQYASATGSFTFSNNQKTDLSGTVQPGAYYLIQQAQGAGGTTNLPTPDATGLTAMSANNGKVALLNSCATALSSGEGVSGGRIVDFVGYGSTASLFEGAGPTGTLTNTTAALRNGNGCTDTNSNAADFTTGTPNPRNSASPTVTCGGGPGPGPMAVAIHDIQGSGSASPLVGQSVSTTGIVTAIKTNGFFLQDEAANYDSDPNTSEAVFVFTAGAPPGAAALGNKVQVIGNVSEFVPSADPAQPPLTELTGASVTLVSSGNALPPAITITSADTNPAGGIEQLEKYEGMRVFVGSLTVIGPTLGSVNEANATATSNGIFFGVISGLARPFREPGVQVPDPLPSGAPAGVPRFDANPERIRVDSDGQAGGTAIDVTSGATVMNITGVLDYAFRTYTILPDPSSPPTFTGNISAVAVSAANPTEFTVATFNLERFFDTFDDPGVGDAVLTQTAFDNRLNKASLTIRNILGMPDFIGMMEAENITVLSQLATRINDDAITAGQPSPNYSAALVEGNDPGGIDVGALIKGSVIVNSITQIGATATFTNPNTGLQDLTFDRPPLVFDLTFDCGGACTPVNTQVVVNHLRSLNDIADPSSGARVRAKRAAGAEFLANYYQTVTSADPNLKLITVGDHNAYEFNDGYVDVMGTIKGTPAAATDVVLASPDLVNPDLINLMEFLPADSRYSYVFDGNAQVLDHIVINSNALAIYNRLEVARVNADFPEAFRNDANRPERLSDHDIPVAYFLLGAQNNPPVADAGPDQTVIGTLAGANVTLDGSASSDPDPQNTLTYEWLDAGNNVVGTAAVIPLALPLGTHVFTLNVSDGTATSSDTVTINVLPPAPGLDVITPASGNAGSSVNVTLKGSNFLAGATSVNVAEGGITVSNVQVISPNQLTATFTLDAGASGVRKISVSTAGGTSGKINFTINGLPKINSLYPSSGTRGSYVQLYVSGANFIPGAKVNVAGGGVTVVNTTRISNNILISLLIINSSAATGPRQVTVTTNVGTSSAATFTVQ
jgi:hypothetical protein